ncbi:O-antigen ligase family protein [Pseudomonas mendocina]|uniref:O-antigen ligase family protein n=1 Tax=Ectopseudomonas oleovorans TaxID=301 RepID=A0AB35KVX5_ECTOL|nr:MULTISPECIES: O-antigen ligase family protein [Pseudomonas aeruginosa group]MCR1825338.1 O-antigen ligase family protein [Pseudomonas oleovorans]MDG9977475.1 O-antigen ligase family protein [Pseudomonas oleovorans]MDH0566251.1 O-antigen ligase family protein [Pseudomonas oleovorans]MDV5862986.1 O-antigen ligase family protein [Pseudomonas mendocina]
MDGWLSWLAIIGLTCFLCGPWLISSNTYYHRLIIALLWVPALAHFLLLRREYPQVDRLFIWLYLSLSVWFLLVVFLTFSGQDGEYRELKLPFYIALTLLGFVVCAMHLRERFSGFLLLCGLLGGLGAGLSCVVFYWLQGEPAGARVVAMGVWRVVIPAAQACGALVILTAMLGFASKRNAWQTVLLLVALLGYGVFLYFNQSRWIWLCLVMAFFGVSVLLRNRAAYAMASVSVLLLALVLLIHPSSLLSRGFSYRPELWAQGFDLLLEHWRYGLGLGDYSIEIAALEDISRHPHNMFLDIGIRFGVLGLLLWAALWGWSGWRAFQQRHSALGRAVVTLWLYSGLVVLTEGTAPWVKPSPIWFVTWLPIALAIVLDMKARQGALPPAHVGEPEAARSVRSSQ